jgi:uncharacterized protein YndB with AHSA1/START domain
MPPSGFILEFFLNASPGIVMLLLTESEIIVEWSGAQALVEKKIGGKVVMFDGWVEGKLMVWSENELAYTWKPSNWPEEIPPSYVHYTLEAAEKGTRIILEHTRFPNTKEMEDHKDGWSVQFFDLIDQYLQK